MIEYNIEEYTATIGVKEFIRLFRNEEVVRGYCRECDNYGRSWGCPPFDFDVEERLRHYDNVKIVATKITPHEQGLPLNAAQELMLPERHRLDKWLLEMEQRHNGLTCSYVGKCLYCANENCTRVCGLPCRHPDKVRPSLEAYGFDVSLISQELFGIALQWSKDGLLPEYLVIVCALFYNVPE